MEANISTAHFAEQLEAHRSADEPKRRYFKTGGGQYSLGDEFMGVRMGQVFALAKEFNEM